MAHNVLHEIPSEVRKSQWYAIIGDETQDASGAEQFALSLRWVDSDYVIYEDFVGLIEVDQTDAKTLMDTIKSALIALNVPLENCRGQAFDGASNMAGHRVGLLLSLFRSTQGTLYPLPCPFFKSLFARLCSNLSNN